MTSHAMMMIKHMYYLILLCLGTAVASGVEYIITPSQPQHCVDQCSSNSDSVDNSLTLSQFVNNSIDYLTDETRLIFPPGNYSLESELIIENFYSFSMIVWPASFSAKVTIVCGSNARFEFRNVSTVTVSGLEFIGCFNNHVVSVSRFQLEDSSFLGHGHAIANGTVLTIDQSAAHLDGISLVSITDKQPTTFQRLSSEDRVIGILLKRSVINITQSWFEGNEVLGGVICDTFGSDITIVNTTFVNNRAITNAIVSNSHGAVKIYNSKFTRNLGVIIFGDNCNLLITNTKFVNNYYSNSEHFAMVNATDAVLVISHSMFTNNNGYVLDVKNTNMSIRYSDFIGNDGYPIMYVHGGMITTIEHSTFINNTGQIMNTWSIIINISFSEFVGNNESTAVNIWLYGDIATSIDHCKFTGNTGSVLNAFSINKISITHSEFIDNTVLKDSSLIYLDGVMITVSLNEFINNRAGTRMVYIGNSVSTAAKDLTNNVFIDNSATYEVYVNPFCRGDHNHSLSLSSSRCITCDEYWQQHLIGIVIAAFIAGIALVIFMLALNITVAVGTLNGILFFANIVAANADTYFSSLETPNIVTVFISWLNLDLGFDVCFFVLDDGDTFNPSRVYKGLMQLAFPAYVTFLVIIVVVFSECSSKFAKIIGKGNPVAVLATMILLSYAKFINAILCLLTLFYLEPSYGSSNVDVTRLNNALSPVDQSNNTEFIAIVYFLIVISALIFFLCIIYTALVFSWQWLLQYQDKIIFKWVRYQKLRLFLEPYHAPYTANYRYWTGLLLFVRVLLYLISSLNFSLDQRVDLISTIFIVGGLLLLKGVTAKRVYKNWPLDVLETAIYFNLVAFSALTWYNLDFGGNQAAVAYMSVMIIFILLLAVIVIHTLRYTRLYKCSCVAKAFKWTSTKLMEKKPKEEPPNDAPEELDGYQLERTVPGDQELPTVTYSVIEIRQPTQNQEEQTY